MPDTGLAPGETLALDCRRACLQVRIDAFTREGFRVLGRTDTTARLVRPSGIAFLRFPGQDQLLDLAVDERGLVLAIDPNPRPEWVGAEAGEPAGDGGVLRVRLAGIGKRAGGLALDGVIVLIVSLVIPELLGGLRLGRDVRWIIEVDLVFLAALVYLGVGYARGQTAGCWLLRLVVLNRTTIARPGYLRGLCARPCWRCIGCLCRSDSYWALPGRRPNGWKPSHPTGSACSRS